MTTKGCNLFGRPFCRAVKNISYVRAHKTFFMMLHTRFLCAFMLFQFSQFSFSRIFRSKRCRLFGFLGSQRCIFNGFHSFLTIFVPNFKFPSILKHLEKSQIKICVENKHGNPTQKKKKGQFYKKVRVGQRAQTQKIEEDQIDLNPPFEPTKIFEQEQKGLQIWPPSFSYVTPTSSSFGEENMCYFKSSMCE